MVQGEERKRKGVLGIRLSHLSYQPLVREHIRQRVGQQQDLFEIVTSIDVGGAQINVRDQNRDAFAAQLDILEPGAGQRYKDAVEEKDQTEPRCHDFDYWRDADRNDPDVHTQLYQAVPTVLGFDRDVDVSGLFKNNKHAVKSKDSGYTELIFQVPESFWANKGLENGPGPS